MSPRRSKWLMSLLFLCATGMLLHADEGGIGQPPKAKATCDFGAGFPKAGSKQGEVVVEIVWANCNQVDLVVGGMSKTLANGQPFLIGNGFSVKGTAQAPLLASGSYTWNIATGEPSGTKITSGTADAFAGAAKLASNGGVKLNVTIP